VVSSNTAFSAAAGASAAAGRYSVRVDALARAAKWRSAGFASPAAPVAGGTLLLTVMGKDYGPVAIADGSSLADLAYAIRQSGAPVSAAVLSDGTRSYLSLTARDTGHAGVAQADALRVAFTPDAGATGQDPAFAEIEAARNAAFEVDGLPFTRASNSVSDAIPGTTLTLRAEGAPAEDLVLANDPDTTRARLQQFVDAYNAVMRLVQKQLVVPKGSDRSATLTGDSAVRDLQSQLQRLTSTVVPGLDTVRSLADVGVKTARDGSISLDAGGLTAAMARDPSAVNALFSSAGSGLAALVKSTVQAEVRAGDGVLSLRQRGLNDGISRLDAQIASMERRLDAFRQNLIARFTAMERIVSEMKAVGNFLTSQAAQQQGGQK